MVKLPVCILYSRGIERSSPAYSHHEPSVLVWSPQHSLLFVLFPLIPLCLRFFDHFCSASVTSTTENEQSLVSCAAYITHAAPDRRCRRSRTDTSLHDLHSLTSLFHLLFIRITDYTYATMKSFGEQRDMLWFHSIIIFFLFFLGELRGRCLCSRCRKNNKWFVFWPLFSRLCHWSTWKIKKKIKKSLFFSPTHCQIWLGFQ